MIQILSKKNTPLFDDWKIRWQPFLLQNYFMRKRLLLLLSTYTVLKFKYRLFDTLYMFLSSFVRTLGYIIMIIGKAAIFDLCKGYPCYQYTWLHSVVNSILISLILYSIFYLNSCYFFCVFPSAIFIYYDEWWQRWLHQGGVGITVTYSIAIRSPNRDLYSCTRRHRTINFNSFQGSTYYRSIYWCRLSNILP